MDNQDNQDNQDHQGNQDNQGNEEHQDHKDRTERPEPPDPIRLAFQVDRDRILHSSSFRRLAGKTQVFIFPDDHQRTRLTHALEVAQVARSVSAALGLNVSLTEAIAKISELEGKLAEAAKPKD